MNHDYSFEFANRKSKRQNRIDLFSNEIDLSIKVRTLQRIMSAPRLMVSVAQIRAFNDSRKTKIGE